MKYKSSKVNTLIKRKNLVLKLKTLGVKRVSPESVLFLEKFLEDNLEKIIEVAKEKMIVNGRKTLVEEDVKKALENLNKKEEGFEV